MYECKQDHQNTSTLFHEPDRFRVELKPTGKASSHSPAIQCLNSVKSAANRNRFSVVATRKGTQSLGQSWSSNSSTLMQSLSSTTRLLSCLRSGRGSAGPPAPAGNPGPCLYSYSSSRATEHRLSLNSTHHNFFHLLEGHRERTQLESVQEYAMAKHLFGQLWPKVLKYCKIYLKLILKMTTNTAIFLG